MGDGVITEADTCPAVPNLGTAEFVRYYFPRDDAMLKVGEASPGGAGRNSTLGLEKLMAIEVPVPPLAVQRTVDRLHADIAALKARHVAIRQANTTLISAALQRIFSTEDSPHA